MSDPNWFDTVITVGGLTFIFVLWLGAIALGIFCVASAPSDFK